MRALEPESKAAGPGRAGDPASRRRTLRLVGTAEPAPEPVPDVVFEMPATQPHVDLRLRPVELGYALLMGVVVLSVLWMCLRAV